MFNQIRAPATPGTDAVGHRGERHSLPPPMFNQIARACRAPTRRRGVTAAIAPPDLNQYDQERISDTTSRVKSKISTFEDTCVLRYSAASVKFRGSGSSARTMFVIS